MTIWHRIFVIADDNSIGSISQKSFGSFFLRGEPSLKRFANQEIHVAVVFYTLASRKPDQVIRIDSQRLSVRADGSIDPNRSNDVLHLTMNRVDWSSSKIFQLTHSGTVVDATIKFDERRWAQYHPQLPGPAIKHILQALFPEYTT